MHHVAISASATSLLLKRENVVFARVLNVLNVDPSLEMPFTSIACILFKSFCSIFKNGLDPIYGV